MHLSCLLFVVAAADFESTKHDTVKPVKDGVDALETFVGRLVGLLERIRASLKRLAAEIAPNSKAATIGDFVDAMAQEAGKKDPLDVAIEEQVTAGAKMVFSLLIARGRGGDLQELSTVFPIGENGREVSLKALSAEAVKYAKQVVALVAEHLSKKKAMKEAKRSKKRSSSGRTVANAS